jgi:hypothetical protein
MPENEKTKRIYPDRIAGRNCDHSVADGDIDAGLATSQTTDTGRYMPIKCETVGSCVQSVY